MSAGLEPNTRATSRHKLAGSPHDQDVTSQRANTGFFSCDAGVLTLPSVARRPSDQVSTEPSAVPTPVLSQLAAPSAAEG